MARCRGISVQKENLEVYPVSVLRDPCHKKKKKNEMLLGEVMQISRESSSLCASSVLTNKQSLTADTPTTLPKGDKGGDPQLDTQ